MFRIELKKISVHSIFECFQIIQLLTKVWANWIFHIRTMCMLSVFSIHKSAYFNHCVEHQCWLLGDKIWKISSRTRSTLPHRPYSTFDKVFFSETSALHLIFIWAHVQLFCKYWILGIRFISVLTPRNNFPWSIGTHTANYRSNWMSIVYCWMRNEFLYLTSRRCMCYFDKIHLQKLFNS